VTNIYPELGCYLYENVMGNLAKNIGSNTTVLWQEYMKIMKTGGKFDKSPVSVDFYLASTSQYFSFSF
jgi:ribosomal protein S19E (S16A)